ncbi:MAG: type VII secretion integral membrane protein EccD [Mycobacterium sp.]
MDDLLCRVSIQCADEARVVDLALPRHAHLAVLLPDIVDLVLGDDPPPHVTPRVWRLDRIRGGRCDESMSLHESGITDGDVMVLSADSAPAPGLLRDDPVRTVSGVAGRDVRAVSPEGVWVGACAVAVPALGYSGAVGGAPIIAAVTALLGAGVCALIAHRSGRAATGLIVRAVCVGFACVSGFLTVPDGPGLPGVVLGAAAGCAASAWLLRSGGDHVAFFTCTTTAFGLLAVMTAVSVALSADLPAAGAALGVLGLGVLGTAGRSAMMLTGLRPAFPGRSGGAAAQTISHDDAIRGRTVFAGLVAAGAATTVLGVGMITVGYLSDGARWPRGVALGAVFAAVLFLRARLYADPVCRASVNWCGLIGIAMVAALGTVSAPRYAGVAVMLTVALAAWCRMAWAAATPVWSRIVDIIEYGLLAVVVPLACWAAGLYDLVRSSSLG